MTNEHFALARSAYAQADFETCLRELELAGEAANASPSTRARTAADAALLLSTLGREKESREKARLADELFTQAANTSNAPAELFAEHGLLLLRDPESIHRAREILERARADHEEDAEIALALLQARRLDKNESENRAHWSGHKLSRELERVLTAAPDGPLRDFRLGRLYFLTGDLKRARARLQAVLEGESEFVSPARRLLIRLCIDTGDYPAAEMLAEMEIQALPHDLEPEHLLARAYLRAYNLDQASAAYEKLASRDGANPRAWTGLGLVQIALAQDGLDVHSRAAQLFTRALECMDPGSRADARRVDVFRARAHALAKLYQRDPRSGYDHLRRARRDLEEALKLSNEPDEIRDTLGIIKARMGFARGLENLKQWGPAGASMLSLLVFLLTQAWLFLDVSAKSLPVPSYIVLTLGSLATGLAGLFLAGRNRNAHDELPLKPPPLRVEPGESTEPVMPLTEPRFRAYDD